MGRWRCSGGEESDQLDRAGVQGEREVALSGVKQFLRWQNIKTESWDALVGDVW